MDLKETFQTIKSKFFVILVVSLVSGALGATAFYYYPKKHYAVGSLFVRRAIYPYSEDHFTYEGFYGQQAAVTYTGSIEGIVTGIDMRAQTLKSLGIEISEKTLREYSRKIKVKRTGPQLITVTVKENSRENAEKLWDALTLNIINVVNGISSTTDPYVSVLKLSEKPVYKESYSDLVVFTATGTGLGFVLSLAGISLCNYLSPKKRKK